MQTTAPPEYWDEVYAGQSLAYRPAAIPFKELFSDVLPHGGSCFEVGCFPGRFLIYLGQTFGYEVSGIDTTPLTEVSLESHIESHGVRVQELLTGDFFHHKFERRYDVVCSFGFVEHFTALDVTLARHAELVAPGGTLFISCPNFRGLQYLLHRTLDAENLRRHVLNTMNLRRWRNCLSECGLELVRDGYYQTAGFWVEEQARGAISSFGVKAATKLCAKLNKFVNWPNPWISPFMYSVWRRPAG